MRHKFQQVLDKIHDFFKWTWATWPYWKQLPYSHYWRSCPETNCCSPYLIWGKLYRWHHQNTISNASKLSWKNFAKKCDPYYPHKRYSTSANFVPSTVQTAPKKIDFKKEWDVSCFIPLFFLSEFVQNVNELRYDLHNHFFPSHVVDDRKCSVLLW